MPKGLSPKLIPVNAPVLSPQARQYVTECLESSWISSAGPFVAKFENAFSKYIGLGNGIAVSSGTAALHLALLALGIGQGDEVLVPAFTMIAPIFAILYTGAKPVFVDCELETFNLDVNQINDKITSKTKAILPVHLFGHPCEMDTILAIAKERKLFVIEDAAEAHGSLYKNRKCGSLGDISCFSFYANKIVTTGEGGMILTNRQDLAEKARALRDLCHSSKRFIHNGLGYNYRLTNLQAAVGLGELENIDFYIEKKIRMANRYSEQLKNIPGIRIPQTLPHVRNVFWMYAILIDPGQFGINKDRLRSELLRDGIDTRDLFYSPEDQPVLQQRCESLGHYPNATYAAQNGCYLPSGLALTDPQIDQVAAAIKRVSRPF